MPKHLTSSPLKVYSVTISMTAAFEAVDAMAAELVANDIAQRLRLSGEYETVLVTEIVQVP